MPAEWGGAGLTILEQVVVQDELGQLTNALWDAVWRPANCLSACTPEQRERYLVPTSRAAAATRWPSPRNTPAPTPPGSAPRPPGTATAMS
ncbi:acyl-CoA dehydrogenase family protein [Streptomyces melanosporofaciens]|uniref:acyl-CoA dehydrogenase family protein n=1 Tax=Streptomyces melanosporofaciens TaxID=67327 RepID=UPI001FCC1D96|nr:acyl-CoA dehydrogenase family protein [Streptomyces melanosporofaciens]